MILSRQHLRNLAITALVIAVVLQFALWKEPAVAQAQLTLTPTNTPVSGAPGQTGIPVTLTVTNSSAIPRTVTFSQTNNTAGVTVVILSSSILLGPGSSSPVSLLVNYASTVPTGSTLGTAIITASSSDTPSASASAQLTFTTTGASPTATPTATGTSTAVPTVSPTPTTGPTCPEALDPGNDMGGALLIVVDVAERHGICSIGDVDWFKFGAVGNKVYTIDISQMDDGLDLSLDLYDDHGNLLAQNDDYFNRNPGSPDPSDIKPQIHSWRAPHDGLYFIRVRDTLNIGGGNRTYTLIVNSESYGPTPITIPQICRDMFEEDGLPEQARLITSNESQYARVLCPSGDADWVKFFAKVGKTYFMYTDTRNYKNNSVVNPETEAGADTVIYLADRDGVSIIDFNDDAPGTLDSEIQFSPSADGFYYLQIKNIGDIGNQFIKYDLTLKECLPGQNVCGRSPAPQTPPQQPTSPAGQATATRTPVSFIDTPTPTPSLSPTTPSGFAQSSLKPGPMVNGPLRGFADPAFERVWQRNDQPIAGQRATRSWAWGPHGLMARTEGYIQSASGLRQVQYFDKARMEVNDPRGDRNSRWFVTTGLLVVELITGRTQIGDNQFVQHAPADIPVAGDQDDPNSPTYASFGGVTGLQPGDRTGQLVGETINRAGQVGAYAGPQRPETRMVHFVGESGHNIPQVFWEFLNASGTIYEDGRYREGTLVDWEFTLGYPISEAYWTRIRVGGVERDVLVQVFQRRVLTYSPDNPQGWQVEMGNVGRHYYFWRYGEQLSP